MRQEILIGRVTKFRAIDFSTALLDAMVSFRIEYNQINAYYYFHVDRMEAMKAKIIFEETCIRSR